MLLLHEAAADETGRALIHQFDLERRNLRQTKGKGVDAATGPRTRSLFRRRHAAIPQNFTFQPFTNPRTGRLSDWLAS
jgi:hypothetical protein